MEYKVDLTDEALANIREIYAYINAAEVLAAASWYRGLRKMIFSLDHDPLRGRKTPESPDLHQLLYGNKPHIYRIIYRADAHLRTVQVVHIRHGARRAFQPEELLGLSK